MVCEHGEFCAGHALEHTRRQPACRRRLIQVVMATVKACQLGYGEEDEGLVGVFDVPGEEATE